MQENDLISYRQMLPADIDSGLKLCREANWNQLFRDWQFFLLTNSKGSCVAVKYEHVVGTVTTISYQYSFSWIGMVLVAAGNRNQGIGKQLLKEALEILTAAETVKLDATIAGRELYLKQGFVDEYKLSRMQTFAQNSNFSQIKTSQFTARQLSENDWPALLIFDYAVFGANRQTLLEWIYHSSPQYSFIVEEQGAVLGYCFGRPGYNFVQIGPVVAEDQKIAETLVNAALACCIGDAVVIDAMHFDPLWMHWLLALGFIEQREFIRMYRGANSSPGLPAKQFAILGPEYG